ncbi:hypothetical protein [Nocardioides sp. Leaf285]|uniref:hypothetical protein n=1 Tax=Nocardioides sp. Leaf285 TaxID=1736322 RepID=UPI0007027869|nr:hypothetical protein [Nocardioides sp. Leaf285]KQP63320.1 hypothetical protein ASF47_14485 [Nocardioides sp. Leaf285]
MNLLSGPVLGAAALVASPALYGGFVSGAVTVDVAVTRWLVAVVVCWVAISLVAMMVGEPPAAQPAVVPADEAPTEELPAQ